MRGEAGQGNKCNKGRGRASSLRRDRFLPDCLPTSLTDPVPGLSPALLDSFLRRNEGTDAHTRGSALLGRVKEAEDAPRNETGDALSPHSQVLVIAPARVGPHRRFSAHHCIPLGISPCPSDSGLAFPGGPVLLQTPNLNRAVRTGMCPLAPSRRGDPGHRSPSITRRTPRP